MYGAIIGDICGSRYEGSKFLFINKDIELFPAGCGCTDDTAMTIAIADALMRPAVNEQEIKANFVDSMVYWARRYPRAGYGRSFKEWFYSKDHKPYYSLGNGSAMRVSPCALYAKSINEALELAKLSAEVSHNHPEGIKGAQAIAAGVFLAKEGKSKNDIKKYIAENFYALERSISQMFEEGDGGNSCMETVPIAIQAFLESEDFEDAIRNAISVGGDTDTIAAMAGSIAWSYYKRQSGNTITMEMDCMLEMAKEYLPKEMADVINRFNDYI